MLDHNPLIRKLESLASLSVEERTLLEQVTANPVAVAPRTDLIREGDPPRGVFLIMDGLACRYKLLPEGGRQVLAYLIPGDFCDLDVALLDAMDHAICAVSACRFVLVPGDTMRCLLDDHPGIARALRLATLVEAATSREWLVNMGRRTCDQRLAHLLCELSLRMDAVGRTVTDGREFPLTQVDLADATGMTSVHVNRTLKGFREQSLVEGSGRQLKIMDLRGLRALAAFDPGYLHRRALREAP